MNSLIKGISIAALALALPIAAQASEPDLEKGAKVFKKCQACHTLEEGGANKIGPNLHGIFTRPAASAADFNYSDAMTAKGAEIGTWTDEFLTEYLAKPRDFVPGTNMSFAGLRKESDLANILAFLKQETGAAE
ncbi:MAG: cytochrome c family protein [Parvibaculum sp.]